jgi:hypothetical protein
VPAVSTVAADASKISAAKGKALNTWLCVCLASLGVRWVWTQRRRFDPGDPDESIGLFEMSKDKLQ